MISRLLKASALSLFLTTQMTDHAAAFWPAAEEDNTGIIELDAKIREHESEHLNMLGMQLMNLAADTGAPMDYIEKQLKNLFNIQIFATVYFGSNKQGFDLIFDSGSSWVWVEHSTCDTCANPNKFKSVESSSFHLKSVRKSSLHYGKGHVIGNDATDMVCLNPESTLGNGCMNNYKFKVVTKQEDLSGLGSSGIIGLSPSNFGSGAQLFVPSLYKQGAIKKNMFSMFVNPVGDSKIQIGGYDLKKYAQSDIHWNKITSPMFWSVDFSDAKVGDFVINTSTSQIMADTGTSLNMLPDDEYNQIFNHFFRDQMECRRLPNTLHSCQCSEEQHKALPDMSFMVNGVKYEIPRDQWVERANNQCIIKFMHGPHKDYWILGLNFFNNYYTVFDYENKQIGFAKSKNFHITTSSAFTKWATSHSLLNLDFKDHVSNLQERREILFMGSLVIATVFVVATVCCTKQKKKVKAQVMPDDHSATYRGQL